MKRNIRGRGPTLKKKVSGKIRKNQRTRKRTRKVTRKRRRRRKKTQSAGSETPPPVGLPQEEICKYTFVVLTNLSQKEYNNNVGIVLDKLSNGRYRVKVKTNSCSPSITHNDIKNFQGTNLLPIGLSPAKETKFDVVRDPRWKTCMSDTGSSEHRYIFVKGHGVVIGQWSIYKKTYETVYKKTLVQNIKQIEEKAAAAREAKIHAKEAKKKYPKSSKAKKVADVAVEAARIAESEAEEALSLLNDFNPDVPHKFEVPEGVNVILLSRTGVSLPISSAAEEVIMTPLENQDGSLTRYPKILFNEDGTLNSHGKEVRDVHHSARQAQLARRGIASSGQKSDFTPRFHAPRSCINNIMITTDDAVCNSTYIKGETDLTACGIVCYDSTNVMTGESGNPKKDNFRLEDIGSDMCIPLSELIDRIGRGTYIIRTCKAWGGPDEGFELARKDSGGDRE